MMAASARPVDAYHACLLAEGYATAEAEGQAWLDSRDGRMGNASPRAAVYAWLVELPFARRGRRGESLDGCASVRVAQQYPCMIILVITQGLPSLCGKPLTFALI